MLHQPNRTLLFLHGIRQTCSLINGHLPKQGYLQRTVLAQTPETSTPQTDPDMVGQSGLAAAQTSHQTRTEDSKRANFVGSKVDKCRSVSDLPPQVSSNPPRNRETLKALDPSSRLPCPSHRGPGIHAKANNCRWLSPTQPQGRE